MSLIAVQQGTPEWLALRVGKCTGSRVKDALSTLKSGGSSAKRRGYLVDVACERLVGYAAEHYVTPAMDWGSEHERYARAAYEVRTGNEVDQVGIAVHPTIADFMASPDGLIGDDGVFEAKCPTTAKHVEWMFEGVVPEEHMDQCLAELMCTEREWLDFVSFDPRMPPRHQLLIVRLFRNPEREAVIAEGVVEFLAEVDAMIAQIEDMNPEILQKIRADEPASVSADDPEWHYFANAPDLGDEIAP